MKKSLSVIALCLLLCVSARAQVFILNDNIFQGRMSEIKTTVLDSLTNEPVGFASVYFSCLHHYRSLFLSSKSIRKCYICTCKCNLMKHIILPLFSLIVLSICCMPTKTKTQKMHFENADIIFVDPCYFAKDDGVWEEYCEDFAQNKSLDKLGCEQSICISVGDVSPDVLVDENDGSVLGSICTDSYVLGCFKLEDVLKYNPEYAEDMEKYPDSFTVIKGFTGDVVFETKKERYYDEALPITTITSIGTIRFHSGFTDDDGSIKLQLSQCNMD